MRSLWLFEFSFGVTQIFGGVPRSGGVVKGRGLITMTVTFFGSVLERTNGETAYEAEHCASLKELCDVLVSRYGEPFNELFQSGDCFFLVNGMGVLKTGGFKTVLNPDDRIDVLPFVDAG